MEPTDRRHLFEPRGLVAGRGDARGRGDVIAHATRPHPAMRDRIVRAAVHAMGRHSLGWIHQARSRVPRCFPPQPPSRRMAPRVAPEPRPAAARGRAVDRLEDDGVTARSRRLAAIAATRRGWAPTVAPLDRPSVHVDGREPRAEAPAAAVRPRTRGDRRAHRPALPHGRREGRVEPQAGRPVLRHPRRGQSREAPAVGPGVKAPMAPCPTPEGTPSRVAARARSTADTRQQLAATPRTGRPRVPATGRDAPAARPPAAPPTRAPRPVDPPRRTHGPRDGAACPTLGRLTCAGDAEAPPALAPCTPGCPAPGRPASAWRATPRARTRGRPRPGTPPDPLIAPRAGALASASAARPPLVDQRRGVSRATPARDEPR